jgi:hypothetical protein
MQVPRTSKTPLQFFQLCSAKSGDAVQPFPALRVSPTLLRSPSSPTNQRSTAVAEKTVLDFACALALIKANAALMQRFVRLQLEDCITCRVMSVYLSIRCGELSLPCTLSF